MDEYEIRESTRAKRLTITVRPDGRVVATKPTRTSLKAAEAFVLKHWEWIERAREAFQKRAAKKRTDQIALPRPRKNSTAYKEAGKEARVLVTERLKHFNELYNFTYGTISIRDQKTRWGSCSAKGNLSFNYRIVYLPKEIQDYIVVHELCHTKEHNHSERFWAQVGRAIPEHASLRKALRSKYAV
ncbi:MAG: SprT family zinc-dependent metalloprotease [Rectinemataceae bacterium]|nr:SprT family zinc-dependent metalloprotease [Rectinemataceae bacterium]